MFSLLLASAALAPAAEDYAPQVHFTIVQVARPDGKPDLTTPSNFYEVVTRKPELVDDSLAFAPDPDGVTRFRTKRRRFSDRPVYVESAPTTDDENSAFKEVWRQENRLHSQWTSRFISLSSPVEVPHNARFMQFVIWVTTKRVEYHTFGRRRIERSVTKVMPSTVGAWCRRNETIDPWTSKAMPLPE